MNSSVTVSVRSLLLAGLVTLGLVTAYLMGAAGGMAAPPAQAAAAQQSTAEATDRTLTMVGSGEATVVPDQLTFDLSVSDKQADLDRALADSSDTLKRVLAALRDVGVREPDVQTTGLRMSPEYDYPAYGPPVLTGYRVTQRALVTVRELAQGGQAVTAAVEAGGNGVRATDLRLGVADPEAALAKARDAAVDAATTKAEEYAAATDQSLGEVVTLREVGRNSGAVRLQRGYAARAVADQLKAVPIRAGGDELAVRVQVVWALG